MSRNIIRCFSHKNSVEKTIFSPIGLENELTFYNLFHGTELTPTLICRRENLITLSYISGHVLRNLPPSRAVFSRLAHWYLEMESHFFKKTGQYCCLEDGNFGNFIVSDNHFVGIDFELWHPGTKEEAFALPLAQIQCMHCENSSLKEEIFNQTFDTFCTFGLSPHALSLRVEKEVLALNQWRCVRPLVAKTAGIILSYPTDSSTDIHSLAASEHVMGVFDVLQRICTTRDQEAGVIATLQASCQTENLFVWRSTMPRLSRQTLVAEFLSLLPEEHRPSYSLHNYVSSQKVIYPAGSR